MYCPSLSLVIVFILKSILSDMRIASPAFFWFPFAWNIFFHPLTFSLYVSLCLKCFSCRQHIYGSWFCIHSASQCLLVGAFNPFTFKVVIYMYVLLPFSYVFRVCYCRSFPSLVFLASGSSFRICCKAGFVVLIFLSFCLSLKVLISALKLNKILAG